MNGSHPPSLMESWSFISRGANLQVPRAPSAISSRPSRRSRASPLSQLLPPSLPRLFTARGNAPCPPRPTRWWPSSSQVRAGARAAPVVRLITHSDSNLVAPCSRRGCRGVGGWRAARVQLSCRTRPRLRGLRRQRPGMRAVQPRVQVRSVGRVVGASVLACRWAATLVPTREAAHTARPPAHPCAACSRATVTSTAPSPLTCWWPCGR